MLSLKRIYGLERKQNNKKRILIHGWNQKFYIDNSDQLIKLVEGLKTTGERLGWNIVGNPIIKETLEKLEKIRDEKDAYKRELENIYHNLLEIKKEKLTSSIFTYENDIKDFEKMLTLKSTPEKDIQDWLKKHIWFFGLEYLDSQPISNISQFTFDDIRLDFFLQRFDTAFDIIELKTFDANLFTGVEQIGEKSVSRENPMSSPIGKAISQMIRYLDLAQHKQKDLLEKDKIDVYYPRGIIIIGRTYNDPTKEKRLRSITAYLRDIDIISYDQLLKKAKTFVEHIKNLR